MPNAVCVVVTNKQQAAVKIKPAGAAKAVCGAFSANTQVLRHAIRPVAHNGVLLGVAKPQKFAVKRGVARAFTVKGNRAFPLRVALGVQQLANSAEFNNKLAAVSNGAAAAV